MREQAARGLPERAQYNGGDEPVVGGGGVQSVGGDEADEAGRAPFERLVCDDDAARTRVARVIELANRAVAPIPTRAGELAALS